MRGESDEGAEVGGGLFTAQSDAFEAFELSDGLFDAGPPPIERSCEPLWPVPGVLPVGNDGQGASVPSELPVSGAVIALVSDDAARFAGVGLQIIRDWVLRFNAEGPEGLKDRKASGPPRKLSEEQRAVAIVESARDPRRGALAAPGGMAQGAVRRLPGCDVDVSLAVTTVGRELRRMGYAKLSARPCHYAQDEAALVAFKKVPRPPERDTCHTGRRCRDRSLVAG